jgi:XRE family transcriptional regulator, aerobic/anaerobic benzoate catabolism transcriptional regulator
MSGLKWLPHATVDCRFVCCSIMHLAIMGPSTTPAKAFTSNSHGFSANGDFLTSLGKRVRELRSRRGMTRKQMSQKAEVSERHLAQLESGEGNISVVLLQRIAAALRVPIANLFAPQTEESAAKDPEKKLIQRFLERLPRNRLEDVVSRLMRDFGREEKMRRMRIALIGLRGAGKSTLGSMLAKDLGNHFVELDSEIEKHTGMPLGEIFSLYGQSGFRAIEKRTLERALKENEPAVISVGGGVVSEKETFDFLLSRCYTVWVKAQPEEHMSRVMAQGDFRPMAANNQAMEDLRKILDAREPLYRKADLLLDTSGTSVEESFAALKAALQQNLQ